jgi:hypothetical protein
LTRTFTHERTTSQHPSGDREQLDYEVEWGEKDEEVLSVFDIIYFPFYYLRFHWVGFLIATNIFLAHSG